jgi:hypothetical protein
VIERHGELGGIWDIENPGTPMYETAQLISSKTHSAFFDFPIPEAYPDYPGHALVLDYLHAFARTHGLYEGIVFDTQVTWAEPDEHVWRVALSSGELRHRHELAARDAGPSRALRRRAAPRGQLARREGIQGLARADPRRRQLRLRHCLRCRADRRGRVH